MCKHNIKRKPHRSKYKDKRVCFGCGCYIHLIKNVKDGKFVSCGYKLSDEGFYINDNWVCNACIKLSGLFDPEHKDLNTYYSSYKEEVKNV